jgi:hypothetical protein
MVDRTQVKLIHVGTSSGDKGCPTVWLTDRGTLVIQGTTVTDSSAIATMRANGLPDHESAVEVPAELLPMIDVAKLTILAFADADRPGFVINDANTATLADRFAQSGR